MTLENLRRSIQEVDRALRRTRPPVDLGSSVHGRSLGRSVRKEVECAHKMFLTASGNYKCRRCLKVFDVVQPTLAEHFDDEAKAVLRRGWR